MENTIEHNSKILKWDYDICPCLDCPIYHTKNEWEEEAEKDVRKDKCFSSMCTYYRQRSATLAWGIYELRTEE